jgi:protein-tyrosine-phosphatase
VRRLAVGLPVQTESFGTLDLGAVPALPEALELAQSCGVDLSAHRTRCVLNASLAGSDLVLGFEEEHVREAVVHASAPRSKTFSLRHFRRLVDALPEVCESDPAARGRDVVARADLLRSELPARLADDLPDPLGGPWDSYRDTAAEIRDHSIALVAGLFGASDSDALPPLPPKRGQSRLRRPRLGQR